MTLTARRSRRPLANKALRHNGPRFSRRRVDAYRRFNGEQCLTAEPRRSAGNECQAPPPTTCNETRRPRQRTVVDAHHLRQGEPDRDY